MGSGPGTLEEFLLDVTDNGSSRQLDYTATLDRFSSRSDRGTAEFNILSDFGIFLIAVPEFRELQVTDSGGTRSIVSQEESAGTWGLRSVLVSLNFGFLDVSALDQPVTIGGATEPLESLYFSGSASSIEVDGALGRYKLGDQTRELDGLDDLRVEAEVLVSERRATVDGERLRVKGTTSDLTVNGDQKIKSEWDAQPTEIKGAVLSSFVILGGGGVAWLFRRLARWAAASATHRDDDLLNALASLLKEVLKR